jgi:hypothetical protein
MRPAVSDLDGDSEPTRRLGALVLEEEEIEAMLTRALAAVVPPADTMARETAPPEPGELESDEGPGLSSPDAAGFGLIALEVQAAGPQARLSDVPGERRRSTGLEWDPAIAGPPRQVPAAAEDLAPDDRAAWRWQGLPAFVAPPATPARRSRYRLAVLALLASAVVGLLAMSGIRRLDHPGRVHQAHAPVAVANGR